MTHTTSETTRSNPAQLRVVLWLHVCVLIGVCLQYRYQSAYLARNPFALSTFSDGQVYEAAARDILAAPPLGTQPFFLQGAYAYLLAAGIAVRGELADALLLQLLVCAAGAAAVYATSRAWHGSAAAALSCGALLLSAALAFYANKYLSAALGVSCNAFVFASFAAWEKRGTTARAGLVGLASAASILARPNLLLALPFTLGALALTARSHQQRWQRAVAAALLGCALGLAPMALRNWAVVGRPTVFPSHGGGIPFYIGNHPAATGLWNTAGGLISGQVLLERQELATRLQRDPRAPDLDRQIGEILYTRAFDFMRSEPGEWLRIQARKLWYLTGNHEFVHDYDWYGEQELLGRSLPSGLFGCYLAIGVLGLWMMLRVQRARGVLVLGQALAIVTANLLWFTSAQNRLPLVVPLVLVLGARWPWPWPHGTRAAKLQVSAALIVAGLIAAQAFIPRGAATRPSSAHYYNLANVEESLGRYDAALEHYARAAERNPKQPMFWLRLAHLAREQKRHARAREALDKLAALPNLPADLRRAAQHERAALERSSD